MWQLLHFFSWLTARDSATLKEKRKAVPLIVFILGARTHHVLHTRPQQHGTRCGSRLFSWGRGRPAPVMVRRPLFFTVRASTISTFRAGGGGASSLPKRCGLHSFLASVGTFSSLFGAQQRLLPLCCAYPAALRARSIRLWGGGGLRAISSGWRRYPSTARLTALYVFSALQPFWQRCGML
ncbi:hypothetical protein NDU88_003049 [Pleurodeles waltl]|uniref:Uncharacterized protein n=1 Tax=Pleurodeles waltl TaxID=8319 RepID=A0AAV7RBS4_PLEWA|nr:hypothetical protein NDU88_003049 [Pleurodeles waltl]